LLPQLPFPTCVVFISSPHPCTAPVRFRFSSVVMNWVSSPQLLPTGLAANAGPAAVTTNITAATAATVILCYCKSWDPYRGLLKVTGYNELGEIKYFLYVIIWAVSKIMEATKSDTEVFARRVWSVFWEEDHYN